MKLLEDLPLDPNMSPSQSSPTPQHAKKPVDIQLKLKENTTLTGVKRIDPNDLSILDLEGTKPLSLMSKSHMFTTLDNSIQVVKTSIQTNLHDPRVSRMKRTDVYSQIIELKAERSIEAIDRTLKNLDNQRFMNDIYGRKNITEQSTKIRDLVQKTKHRMKEHVYNP